MSRLSPLPPIRDTIGDIAAMALYAGRSGAITSIEPAGTVVLTLVAEADALLATRGDRRT